MAGGIGTSELIQWSQNNLTSSNFLRATTEMFVIFVKLGCLRAFLAVLIFFIYSKIFDSGDLVHQPFGDPKNFARKPIKADGLTPVRGLILYRRYEIWDIFAN